MSEFRIVALASGRGSNFAAILGACLERKLSARVVGLITNKSDAPALEIAKLSKVPTTIVDEKSFRKNGRWDRAAYEVELLKAIESYQPNLICLTGYMRILGKAIVAKYPEKIVNIHPSLLPSFRGLRAQQQALDAGVKWTGCTVHFVSGELDGGRILEQSVTRIEEGDTEETLSKRLLPIEHETYVRALKRLTSP
ncbi:MAG: phosphoribosylglycinamide formyltransferase [Deltaproteobacteria bacterium]|nr:phosphoribosylglycinamide formyltransferase [Deltaproteobacteria bacterium]MBI3296049.1 phosphoribosylglycinamide formyltransferase [Deltaproteobacteria bacterium]